MSRPWLRPWLAAVVLIAALLAPSTPARAAAGTYQCTWPIVNQLPATIAITVGVPTGGTIAVPVSGAFSLEGDAGLAMQIVAASTIEGSASVGLLVEGKAGEQVATTASLQIPRTTYDSTSGAQPVTFTAAGATVPFAVPPSGVRAIVITSVSTSLLLRDFAGQTVAGLGDTADSDGSAATFDGPCGGPATAADLGAPSSGVAPAPTPQPYVLSAPILARATASDSCAWPIIGEQPMTVRIGFDAPEVAPASTPLRTTITLQLVALQDVFFGFQLIGASSISGTISAVQRAATSAGPTIRPVARINLPEMLLPQDDPGRDGIVFRGSAALAPITLPAGGTADWAAESVRLNLTARDATGQVIPELGTTTDSDRDPTTFDVPCTRSAPAPLGRTTFAAPQLGTTPATDTPAVPTTPTPSPTPAPGPEQTRTAATAPEPSGPPAPAPTPGPTPPPAPPAVVIDDHVLRFRSFLVPLRFAASCPRLATVVIRGSHGDARRVRVRRHVRLAPTQAGCSLTSTIRLPARLAQAGALQLKVTGTGLRSTSRRVTQY